MRKVLTATVLAVWTLGLVAPATAVALDTATVVPAEVCAPDDPAGCKGTHQKHTITVDPETGDYHRDHPYLQVQGSY